MMQNADREKQPARVGILLLLLLPLVTTYLYEYTRLQNATSRNDRIKINDIPYIILLLYYYARDMRSIRIARINSNSRTSPLQPVLHHIKHILYTVVSQWSPPPSIIKIVTIVHVVAASRVADAYPQSATRWVERPRKASERLTCVCVHMCVVLKTTALHFIGKKGGKKKRKPLRVTSS